MAKPLIQMENVTKKFGEQIILDKINLSINQGEVTTIIGKSGVGKSVLLKHLIGLLYPDSGEVLFNGKPVAKMGKEERRELKRKFSYMFQNTALFDSMTIFDNIALPLRERHTLSKEDINIAVRKRMDQLDLHEIDDKYPSQLSGGMKKRVALARALVTDPQIILFDEPTTGLDPIRKNAVYGMISDYQKRFGFTAILVSHDIPEIFYISQCVAMLDDGTIIFQGTSEEIQMSPNPVVQEFIHGLEKLRDILTGIPGGATGEKRFKEAKNHLRRHRIAFSLILIIIENVDQLNDTIGYEAVQTLIRNFIIKVHHQIRSTDTCSRYSFNKIIIVLSHTNIDQAFIVCANLAKVIKIEELLECPFPNDLPCPISIGFAEAREDSCMEEVVANAEARKRAFHEFTITIETK
ncbi:MAG: ATP-binding cassette domain-containing protein [bacterium]